MIEITNLSFSYNSSQRVLNNITLKVNKSEVISIIGKSGCGKTTLLNLISGLLQVKNGKIKVINSEISYLTQRPTLLSYRNAFENAILGLELRNNSKDISTSEVKSLFSLFGLKDALSQFPNELSGGMKQRVGLIQTIAIDSDIYLLDEPFSAIDRNTLLIVEDHLWQLFNNKGATAVLVTHDIEQAISFSDRILLLSSDPGTIVYDQIFAQEYIDLPPSKRKTSPFFSEYLFEIVKKFSEL